MEINWKKMFSIKNPEKNADDLASAKQARENVLNESLFEGKERQEPEGDEDSLRDVAAGQTKDKWPKKKDTSEVGLEEVPDLENKEGTVVLDEDDEILIENEYKKMERDQKDFATLGNVADENDGFFDDEEASSFEDRDIFAQMMRESEARTLEEDGKYMENKIRKQLKGLDQRDALKKQKKEWAMDLEKRPDYSLDDFKLMRSAVVYRNYMDGAPETMASRPKFADQVPLTNEQIIEQVSKLKAVGNDHESFSKTELELMNACDAWFKLVNEKAPKSAGKNPKRFSEDQIDELVNEYRELRKSDPKRFDALKEEMIDEKKEQMGWKPGVFSWNANVHDGKTRWVYTKFSEQMINGKLERVETLYVTNDDPALAGPVLVKSKFYYKVTSEMLRKNDPKKPIVFVKLDIPAGAKKGNVSQKKVA